MPYGDSITYGNNYKDLENPRPTGKREAYRSHLYYKLQNVGIDADFVGSQKAGEDISPPFDPDNEGHAGWSSYRLADHTLTFLNHNPPDIMLIHAGTNDHSNSVHGVENILNLIDEFEVEYKQKITIVLALIIDRLEHDKLITQFNENLRTLAQKRIQEGDSIVLVDMEHDAGLTSGDYADETHPNSNGYDKMADVWLDALIDIYHEPEENPTLRAYPYTLVPQEYIEKIYVNSENNSVTFVTEVPDTGITF